MSYLDTASGNVVKNLSVDQRAGFIRRTYAHVALAIGFMAVSCAFLLQIGVGEALAKILSNGGIMTIVIYFGLFIGAGIVADRWARSEQSVTMHYVALLGYAFVEALIVVPALYVASVVAPSAITDAAITTAALVTAITYIAFTTKKDFSFLGPYLMVGGVIAMVTCVAGWVLGFELSLFVMAAIVALAGGFVLFNTSNIIHVYQEHQHVAASLSLFASIAFMFRFILQMFMSFGDD